MAAVNVTKRVQVPGKGWRWCKVVRSNNGKIKPDVVVIDGQEQTHTEGVYYLRFLQRGQHKLIPAGSTAADAQHAADKQERLLAAHEAAAAAGTTLAPAIEAVLSNTVVSGRSLKAAVDEYLLEIEAHKKPKTHMAYRKSLGYFLESCRKNTLEEITRADMLAFITYLRKEQGLIARTIWNKFSNVMGFLKWAKITGLGIGKNDWPKYTEEEVDVYSPKELEQFFDACSEMETVWFKFFRFTGMREQEVMYAEWSWINFERKVVTVQENKRFGWTPKEDKGREIAVPSSLIDLLKTWKAKSDKTCGLIFPTSGCKPKLDFLDECKAITERAGMNKDNFYLHKFRATRTTEWARNMSVSEAMQLSGHSDYESFKRYLGKQSMDVLQEKIEKMDSE